MHLTCFQSSITICMDSNYGQRDLRGMTESSHHSARTSRSVRLSVCACENFEVPYLTDQMKVLPQNLFHTAYRLVLEIFDFLFYLSGNYQ